MSHNTEPKLTFSLPGNITETLQFLCVIVSFLFAR